jgi:rare lipoprotein A
MRRSLWVVAIALVLLAGCTRRRHTPAAAIPRVGAVEEGIASWYGHPYHGRASSSGEIYDMEKMTAAHRTLPFGTEVRVHNLTNGRTVDVRINDRGPFVDGRIIDLSRAAARQMHLIGPGTARVRLHILSVPEAPESFYAVQVGAYRDRDRAERQRLALRERFGTARLERRDGEPVVWRVLVGREPTLEGARSLADRISKGAFVVRVEAASND